MSAKDPLAACTGFDWGSWQRREELGAASGHDEEIDSQVKFKNGSEEFELWSSTGAGADSTEYLDGSEAKRAKLANLRPTLRTISVRLPVSMIEDLRSRI